MTTEREPLLEMLWEAHEPRRALTERFGLEDAAAADRWLRETVSAHWHVMIESCARIVMSDSNALAWLSTTSGPMILKWSAASERFVRLHRVALLTQWLRGEGLPVSAPVPSPDGALQIETNNVSMSLQHVIDGELLDVGDLAQVRAAGATLASLHEALRRYPGVDQPIRQSRPTPPLRARIMHWLDAADSHLPSRATRALRSLAATSPELDDVPQLLHGDFRSANILCNGSSVVGVLDFEELRRDHRVDEVARAAALLGTRFHDWGPVSPDVHAEFLAGYESAWHLSAPEKRWWELLVLWYTLAFVPVDDDPTGWSAAALELADTIIGNAAVR